MAILEDQIRKIRSKIKIEQINRNRKKEIKLDHLEQKRMNDSLAEIFKNDVQIDLGLENDSIDAQRRSRSIREIGATDEMANE